MCIDNVVVCVSKFSRENTLSLYLEVKALSCIVASSASNQQNIIFLSSTLCWNIERYTKISLLFNVLMDEMFHVIVLDTDK